MKTMTDLIYKMKTGLKLSGTLEQICEVCKKLGETVEIDKIEGIDKSKFYYSKSKSEWLSIETMATPHIMNALKKNILGFYENLKVEKDMTISDFMFKLDGWRKHQFNQNLMQELTNRRAGVFPAHSGS